MKNKEGYRDPTAALAIANIRRQEKRRKKNEERHEPSTAKKTNTDAEGKAAKA